MWLKFLEDGDFSHGGRWHTLIFILKFDLLEGDKCIMHSVFAFEDHSIGAFSESLHLFISVVEFLEHLANPFQIL